MKITLAPCAGLCNRINAMMHAITLSDAFDYEIDIFWEKTSDCSAEFTDLFMPIDTERVNVYKLNRFYLKPACRRNFFITNFFRKFHFDGSYTGAQLSGTDIRSFITDNPTLSSIYISSSNRFSLPELPQSLKSLGKVFIPQSNIETKIKAITDMYSSNTVGIHIRRSDNVLAIKNNPIEKFTTQIDNELLLDSNCRFYVASDSEDEKNYLKSKYGDCIITKDSNLTRNSLDGIVDAVVELYCLARTNKIYGCTNSTYSTVASRLYDIPLVL